MFYWALKKAYPTQTQLFILNDFIGNATFVMDSAEEIDFKSLISHEELNKLLLSSYSFKDSKDSVPIPYPFPTIKTVDIQDMINQILRDDSSGNFLFIK